jgi:phosphoglucosamine mutase
MPQFPQVMVNVRVRERIDPGQSPAIQEHVRRVEQALGATGRVVLRASGTEPLIRVMVEGQDDQVVARLANELAETVRGSV